MAHLRAQAAPAAVRRAVGELDQIQRVLDELRKFRLVHLHQLIGLVLAGQAHIDHRQGLGADQLAQQEVFVEADAQGLVVVGILGMPAVLLLRAVDGPAVEVAPAALRRADALLPAVAVVQRVALDDAPAREAQEPRMQPLEQLEQIPAEHARHGVPGHHGDEVELHHAGLIQRNDKPRAGYGLPRLQRQLVADPPLPGLFRHMDARHPALGEDLPVLLHGHRQVALVFHHPGVEGDVVGHPLDQVNAAVRLIPEALARLPGGEAQVVGIHPVDRAAHDIGHGALAALRGGMPGIAAVLHGVVVAHSTAAVQGFKGTVLNHFGVEAAVGSVVDVLKEQADHPGLNRDALFIGNVQLHEAYHPFHTHKTPGIRAYALLHSACTGEFLLPGTDFPGNGAIAPGGHTKKTNRIICMETVWADFVSSTI